MEPKAAYAQPVIGGEHKNISASAQVKAGDGHLIGIFVSSSSSGTIKVWDSLSATGAIVVNTFSAAAATWYPIPAHFKTGCYVTLAGTIDCTPIFI